MSNLWFSVEDFTRKFFCLIVVQSSRLTGEVLVQLQDKEKTHFSFDENSWCRSYFRQVVGTSFHKSEELRSFPIKFLFSYINVLNKSLRPVPSRRPPLTFF